MLEVFAAKGAHARSAFGVAQVPFGSCVEIELIAEVPNRTACVAALTACAPRFVAAQGQRLGLEQLAARCSWQTYTKEYIALLAKLTAQGVSHVVFGDIIGDTHRAWNERVCGVHGLTPIMPLWAQPTALLVRDFIATGAEARLVTVKPPVLDESWLGLTVTEQTVTRLEALGVDPCGEFGEYHTLVTNCSRFSPPLRP